MDSVRDSPALGLLLARAYEFEERSRLLAALALLLAGALHALVLTPWTETLRQREEAAAERTRLAAPLEEVAALEASITSAREAVDSTLQPALERLASDLENDLRRVGATREATRRMMEEGIPEETEDAEENAASGAPEPFQIDNLDWIFDIGRARSRDELLTALTPLVEARVIGPRFSAFEARWAAEALPRVEAHLDHLAGAVPGLRGLLPEQSAALDELAAAVAAQRRAARDLRFRPPERDDWWTSAALSPEEEWAGEELSLRLDPAVRAQILEPLELDQLEVTATRTEAAWRALLEALEKRQTALTAVSEGPGPERSREIASRYSPLVLGLLFAVLLAWRAGRTRELGLLAGAARIEGAALREWLLVRAGGATRRAFALRVMVVAMLGLAWIALAAWQAGIETERTVLAAAVGGAVVFVLTLGYSVAVSRRVRARLAPRPSAPRERPPEPPEPPERDGDDGLEGLSLR